MVLKHNGFVVNEYTPEYMGRRIVIGIDSSKSNTAIVVANDSGVIIDDYEINGSGSNVEVYQLCWEVREALKTLFHKATIVQVGIEDIITKNEKNKKGAGYKGIEIHTSRAKITAVFNNIIFFFQDYHKVMPILINNNTWKSHILPESYRTRAHNKGSKDWFNDLGNRWAGRSDDVTDAVCITQYLLSVKPVKKINVINGYEPTTYPYRLMLAGVAENIKYDKLFETSLDDIPKLADTMVNKIDAGAIGACVIDIESIEPRYLYKHLSTQFKLGRNVKQLYLLVNRGE